MIPYQETDDLAYVRVLPDRYGRAGRLSRFIRRATVNARLQICILILSAAAVELLAQSGPISRYGYIVGLASQPFWFAATWRARQWGMFTLSIFYTGVWVQGICNHF